MAPMALRASKRRTLMLTATKFKMKTKAAKALEMYLREAGKKRRLAHKEYLALYKALPANQRRDREFVMPGTDETRTLIGDGVCWQCCGPTRIGGRGGLAAALEEREERSPLDAMKLPTEVTGSLPSIGDLVAFCFTCFDQRCEALGLKPPEQYTGPPVQYT